MKTIFKIGVVVGATVGGVFGEYRPVPPTLAEILSHKPSITRDFFLTEYIRTAGNPGTAFKAYKGVKRKRLRHFRMLAKRFPTQFLAPYQCVDVRPSYLRKVDPGCILEGGLSYQTLYKLKKSDKLYLLQKLPKFSQIAQLLQILLTRDYQKILNSNRWTSFFLRHYPYFLKPVFPKIDWNRHIKDVYGVIHTTAIYGTPFYAKFFSQLNQAIVQHTPDKVKWDLALIAIRQNKIPRAIALLKSIKKPNPKYLFWLYLLTKDKKYLQRVARFNRLNFYTLYAYEAVGKRFKLITKVNHNSVKNPRFNQFDPWSVADFKRYLWQIKENPAKLKELAAQLDSSKSFALKAVVLDRLYNFNRNYFLIPWGLYRDKNLSFRAFVYGIARQESRFIPGEVSTSYALGVMQVMPFLVRHYRGNIYNQFDYRENVQLGVKELKMLFKALKNPLFVAYAYNGGIGFVKRRVLPKFRWVGRFEPFLSMELVPKSESRHYGKIVLANYIIYQQLFGNKKITLHKWLAQQRAQALRKRVSYHSREVAAAQVWDRVFQ
ncbi:MAG: transglycosylase SLT domain-containing protein [Campylobacterales bacterium]